MKNPFKNKHIIFDSNSGPVITKSDFIIIIVSCQFTEVWYKIRGVKLFYVPENKFLYSPYISNGNISKVF